MGGPNNRPLLLQEVRHDEFGITPLFSTAIGFDRLARQMDSAPSTIEAAAYPPYNVEKTSEDLYRLTMAVAGFSRDDLTLTVQDDTLIVAGRVSGQVPKPEFLYRGIAGRHFERRLCWPITSSWRVPSCRTVFNVGLNRVMPEALKLRNIAIAAAVSAPEATANDGGMIAQVA